MSLTHHSPLCSDVLQCDHADGGLLRGHHHPGEYPQPLPVASLAFGGIGSSLYFGPYSRSEKCWKRPDVVSVAGVLWFVVNVVMCCDVL